MFARHTYASEVIRRSILPRLISAKQTMTRAYGTSGDAPKQPFSTSLIPRPTKLYHLATYDRLQRDHGFDGRGKTVLITGGAGGVGYEISKAFAAKGIARLVIVSRNREQQASVKTEIESLHPTLQVDTHVASVTDADEMSDLLQQQVTPDILVLNAAMAHRRAEATEITDHEMYQSLETNVMSTFQITKAYLKLPPPVSGRKTIINLSGAAAHIQGPYRVGYGPSKAAAAQIMQTFASQYRDTDTVKIYNYHPGSFYTPGVAQNIPHNKMVWEDIRLPADFAVWLAGPQAEFLHGRYVWANWDVDELISMKDKVKAQPDFLTIGLVQ